MIKIRKLTPAQKATAVIVSVAVVATIGCVLLSVAKRGGAPVAEIFKDGELIYEIDLSNVKQPYELAIGGNLIEVRDGEIGVIRADCPDKTCVRTGFTRGVKPIICVPNRLEIRVIYKS